MDNQNIKSSIEMARWPTLILIFPSADVMSDIYTEIMTDCGSDKFNHTWTGRCLSQYGNILKYWFLDRELKTFIQLKYQEYNIDQ